MAEIAEIIGSILYVVAATITTRLAAGHLAWSWRNSKYERNKVDYPYLYRDKSISPTPSGEQWFGAVCFGIVIGLAWPLALLFRQIRIEQFAIGAEAREINERQRRRIAELERENL